LRDAVSTDLAGLFLLLAAVCLAIGAVGIANTTMVAVLERVPEIGLRRALGARRRHATGQFFLESGAIGTAGGLVGATSGLPVFVAVALMRQWTPVTPTWTVLVAPLAGTLVGLMAGAYPAFRAGRIEPAAALRR
jgi:putative ABC transport system permease protein